MLRLSKLTDYAVAVLIRLDRCQREGGGEQGACMATAPHLAALTGIPEPTVAKVLKTLAGSGFVTSARGARGGYRLSRPLEDIALDEVISALDGPIALITCIEGTGGCEAYGRCDVRGRWEPVNEAVRSALRAISLAELRGPGCCSERPPMRAASPREAALDTVSREAALDTVPREAALNSAE
ncbi:SUF system Fe-S cluster assembly regulator [Endobacter medicaginis]|uniref:SUF system Fe-S cluster assembly regulator n=1 Tax=Endobacter medicaginis TaxID=1181271 RepID=A0A850NNZ9_9PROT|nr:SUF system Fe-S cluster assembly regulator [Endobacter medicaginis]NVN29596.1 SUF system Fe-S cluster assembly regulator [Endobacter medicaginis]